MIKTKQELLNHFSDINTMYNNSFMYQTLSNMIDELLLFEQQPCEDCVSRKAVEEITWEEPSYTDALNAITEIREKIRQLPSVTPEQTRLTPVSEALPARDVNVLTYHRNVSFDYQYVSWIDEYSGKWAGFIGNLPDEVLAWMPLPEPYKAESEGE